MTVTHNTSFGTRTKPQALIWMLSLTCAAALTACGGGGSDSSSSNPGTGTGTNTGTGTGTNTGTGTATESVTLLAMPTTAPQAPASTGDIATDAFNWMNYRRAQIGLAAMKRQSQLDQAALAHANYISLNGSDEGHNETPGKPGFTGATPSDRAKAAGYASGAGENISHTSNEMKGGVFTDILIDAPFHRSSQFSTYLEAGTGAKPRTAASDAWQTSYVINFSGADTSSSLNNKLWSYPSPGQNDAFLDWIVNESPSPMPDYDGKRVGYPITLHAPNGKTLSPSTFSLTDSSGNPVTVRAVTSMNLKALAAFKDLGGYALWIPVSPLSAGMTYTASATGKLDGKDFSVKWSFTTLAATPLQMTTDTPGFSGPNTRLKVTLTGGSGRYEFKSANWNYDYVMPSYPGISIKQVAPNEWVLVRDAIACANTSSTCGKANIVLKDTAGNEISKTLTLQ